MLAIPQPVRSNCTTGVNLIPDIWFLTDFAMCFSGSNGWKFVLPKLPTIGNVGRGNPPSA